MSNEEKTGGGIVADDGMTPEVELALREFRLYVHAWSEAAMSRPRLASAPQRQLWRLAAGWALSSLLIVGGVTAGVYGHHRQQLRIAQARTVEQQRRFALQQAPQARLTDEDLLAKVDSDISQTVPSAMEPLAQMMAEDEMK
ncbi:MAG TPA: hypothetical protein VGF01_18315 [Terracidiphilus sp.]|jgi:hypothetical protein